MHIKHGLAPPCDGDDVNTLIETTVLRPCQKSESRPVLTSGAGHAQPGQRAVVDRQVYYSGEKSEADTRLPHRIVGACAVVEQPAQPYSKKLPT